MIDYEKLKIHPLMIIIAKIEAQLIADREIQKEIIGIVARDIGCPKDLLLKVMRESSQALGANK